jgi:hypothetical protein
MENDHPRPRHVVRKGAGVIAAAGLAIGFALPKIRPADPKETAPPAVGSGPPRSRYFQEIVFSATSSSTPSLTPQPTTESSPTFFIPTPEPTIDPAEMGRVIFKMHAHTEYFTPEMINVVEMYYPIYKAVGDKFNVRWYLIFLVHWEESTGDDNIQAFDGSSAPHMGGMQINPDNYKNIDLKNATSDLEYLKKLRTKHPERDLQDIAEGALILHTDIQKYENHGYSEDDSVEIALEKYTNVKTGQYRFFAFYKPYEKIFG